jgi:hypothetical protein
MPKIGDLVDWKNDGITGAYGLLVSTYGEGPFRITNRKYEFTDNAFYYKLKNLKEIHLEDWFISHILRKYDWGLDLGP